MCVCVQCILSVAVRLPVIVWMCGCLIGWLIDSWIDHTHTGSWSQVESNWTAWAREGATDSKDVQFGAPCCQLGWHDLYLNWFRRCSIRSTVLSAWTTRPLSDYTCTKYCMAAVGTFCARVKLLFTSSATVLFSWVEILYKRRLCGVIFSNQICAYNMSSIWGQC